MVLICAKFALFLHKAPTMKEAWTATAQMWYNEETNILRILIPNNVNLGLEDVKNHYVVANRLTSDKKPRVLVDIRNYFTTTPEARKYAIQQSGARMATAIITRNLIAMFFVNLYIRLGKPVSPTRFFLSEEKALEWLNGI